MNRSASYSVLLNFKKELNLNKEIKRTFISFLKRLVEKGKEYMAVSNSKEVNNPKKIFDIASILIDNLKEKSFTNNILEDLDKLKELK